jgi:outer membrane protein
MNRLEAVLVAAASLLAALPASAAEPLKLSMADAVGRALRDGTAAELADEQVASARAAASRTRSALLPQLGVEALAGNQSINLETYGLRSPDPVVPPFDVFEGRAGVRWAVLDLAAIQRHRAVRALVGVSEADRRRIRSEAASAVSRLYVSLLKAQAQVNQHEATLKLFEKVLGLARRQRDAGVTGRRDSLRAEVQLNQQRSALLVAKQRREDAKRALLEAMGADLGLDVTPTDDLAQGAAAAGATPPLADLLRLARARRAELQVVREQKRAADAAVSAVSAERLPAVHAQVHFEETGNSLDGLAYTRGGGVRVSLPLFTGGRIGAEMGEAKARQRAVQIRDRAASRLVERQVRDALHSLETARERVATATENARLTAEDLESAQNRLGAGVAASVEVDNAQTTYVNVREELVAAQADLAQARVDLDFATGALVAEATGPGRDKR